MNTEIEIDPNIPRLSLLLAGYHVIRYGMVHETDLLWTPETRQWESPEPSIVGSPVASFKAVATKR